MAQENALTTRTTPPSSDTPGLRPIRSTEELAAERFGDRASLATSSSSVVELAAHYAASVGLSDRFGSDPEVTTAAIILASSRMTQATLMFEKERDLEELMMELGYDYGKALFHVARGGRHKAVWDEIDRQERRASVYLGRLSKLAAPESD